MSINNELDVKEIRVTSQMLPKSSSSRKRTKGLKWIYQPKGKEKFLRGPIPWEWLLRAGKRRGKAFHVAIALWFYAGLHRNKTFGFNQSRLEDLGLTRDSARRGLHELEKQKLVSVKRHAGRKPIVTILIRPPRKEKRCRKANTTNGNGKESSMKGDS